MPTLGSCRGSPMLWSSAPAVPQGKRVVHHVHAGLTLSRCTVPHMLGCAPEIKGVGDGIVVHHVQLSEQCTHVVLYQADEPLPAGMWCNRHQPHTQGWLSQACCAVALTAQPG
jgi:hypothetical protein